MLVIPSILMVIHNLLSYHSLKACCHAVFPKGNSTSREMRIYTKIMKQVMCLLKIFWFLKFYPLKEFCNFSPFLCIRNWRTKNSPRISGLVSGWTNIEPGLFTPRPYLSVAPSPLHPTEGIWTALILSQCWEEQVNFVMRTDRIRVGSSTLATQQSSQETC